MKTCESCIHFEVCAIYLPQLPICDSYISKGSYISKDLFDQIKWEFNIAIEQLSKLGIGFGEKIDGIYLTKEEYKKLLEYKWMYEELTT